MDDLDDLFKAYDQYRIVICIQCQFAVVPSQMGEHLRKHHRRLSLQHRRRAIERVQALPNLAQLESDVVYPRGNQPPIDGIPVFFDGLRCLGKDDQDHPCPYVCRTVYGIQEHCKGEHGWINKQKRGGNVRAKQAHPADKLWKSGCACQRFFKVGKWQRYFEVEADACRVRTENLTSQKYEFFQSQEEDIAQAEHDTAEEASRVRGFEDHRSTVVPWLRETGIVDHLRGLKKDEIRAAIAIPSADDESDLRRIIDATESLLMEAHSWCFDGPECMLTWPCRVVLNRFQSLQVESMGHTRPFNPFKEPSTLKSYFKLALKALSYFHRVAASDEYFFSAELGGETLRLEDCIEPTEEQLAAWRAVCLLAEQEITDEDEETERKLKDRLLDFWMLLVCHTTGSRRYRSPLLSFCAMLSIKPTTQGWMEPGNFNSNLSAIIWVVQLLIFYDSARKERQNQGETLALVKQCCERHLQQTVETPMGEILRWRLLLFRVSKDSVSGHEASWDEDEQVLTYEDTELHLDQIPTLLVSEYRQCQQLLYDDLMLGQNDLRRIPAWLLNDGLNVDTVGWNFTQHRDNANLLKQADRALLAAIERSDQLSLLFLASNGQLPGGFVWRESALATYEATVQEFLKRLCVLIHVSGGQPVRESEFFSMTWRNTQRRRSITLRHDRVMIHVQYHKGQQQTGRYKENVRFLAPTISDLVLNYIIYVMPLRQIFLRQQSAKAVLSSFLWEKDGKVWREGQLSQCLEDASARACIPRLHVSNWRQMTVAIVKTKFASQIGCFEADDEDEDAEEIEENIRSMTKQRNHKTQTVNRAYANQTGAAFSNVWDGLIRMGLRASNLWQDFWGVETILQDKKRARAREEPRLTKRVAMGVYRPRKSWSAEALLGGARKLYSNEEMVWKSVEQEQALTTIMSWTEQVVAILPTGAGKSLLFMLPCTLPDAGTTILVVPLVSLRGDLLRRIDELKIDYLEWLPGESRDAPLVFVSVEAAGTKEFLKYARALLAQQRLDRVVVDECHLTVTAVEYRPSMVDLTAIRSLRTQFVYLTATLPPSMQPVFEERNYLHHPTIIRASSNRPNIFYMVRKANSQQGSLLKQSAAEVRDAWETSGLFDQARDKIILYVRKRDEADELAASLSCDSYTAESGTPTEKHQLLVRWIRTSGQPYIVATTALAEGFDYPYVRLVVNVNEPESLVTFVQESGRAGRDGKKAYSLVLLPTLWMPQDDPGPIRPSETSSRYDQSLSKHRERQAVHRYLRGEQCYRTSLTECLDVSQHRRWCMIEDVPCDVCQSSHGDSIGPRESIREEMQHTGLDLIQQDRLRKYTELAQYRAHLGAVRGICLLCRARGNRWDHAFAECNQRHEVFAERRNARRRYELKGRTWLKPFSACFWCLNPQSICPRAETRSGSKEGECEYRDIVLPLCYGIIDSMQGPSWIEERFERKFQDVERYVDWLGEETEFGGGKAIQAVRVAAEALHYF